MYGYVTGRRRGEGDLDALLRRRQRRVREHVVGGDDVARVGRLLHSGERHLGLGALLHEHPVVLHDGELAVVLEREVDLRARRDRQRLLVVEHRVADARDLELHFLRRLGRGRRGHARSRWSRRHGRRCDGACCRARRGCAARSFVALAAARSCERGSAECNDDDEECGAHVECPQRWSSKSSVASPPLTSTDLVSVGRRGDHAVTL